MKVFKDGTEVKDARVIYSGMTGKPSKVEVKGQVYSASLYTFEDEESKKQTKPAARTKKVSDQVMTTKNTPAKRKK